MDPIPRSRAVTETIARRPHRQMRGWWQKGRERAVRMYRASHPRRSRSSLSTSASRMSGRPPTSAPSWWPCAKRTPSSSGRGGRRFAVPGRQLRPSALGAGQPRGRAVERLSEDSPLLGFCSRTLSWCHQGRGSSGSIGASGSAEKTPAFACQLLNTPRNVGWGSCGRGPLREATAISFAWSVTVNVTVNGILAQGS